LIGVRVDWLVCHIIRRLAALKAKEQHEETKGTKFHKAGNPELFLGEEINSTRAFT
jgi:hypothetical protein